MVLRSWDVLDCHIERLDALDPPCLSLGELRLRLEPLEGTVIGAGLERPSIQVRASYAQEFDEGEEFLFVYRVVE